MRTTQSIGDDDNMTSRTKNTGDVDKGQCDRLSDEAIMDMEFASWEAAEVFYNAYAKQVGFSIRRRDVRKSRGGELRMVKWVCAKEGFRDNKWLNLLGRIRKPLPQTREGCQAMIRVNFNRTTGKWIVKDLESSHTHDLVLPKHTQLLPSQCDMTEGMSCRHILNVLKLRKMIVIPVACFLPRWTKQAKANESSGTTPTLDNNLVETMRYGALICQCYKLCELAKKNGECYENTMANIARAMNEVANYDFITRLVKRKYEDVKDPDVVRTKGNATVTPKSKGKGRKCGVCHVSGHTRVTCPSNKGLEA
ncbi:Protein FAR1-RELATED SEQUENCE 5 [Linum perenne]